MNTKKTEAIASDWRVIPVSFLYHWLCWNGAFLLLTSNYSRIGSSQSLWVWQLQDTDVQLLEWILLAVAAGCHSPFSVFLSRCDMIVLCITPTLFIFTPFSCNNGELTHCGMFSVWERKNLHTEVLFVLPKLLYLFWPEWNYSWFRWAEEKIHNAW